MTRTGPARLPSGGLIDRDTRIPFHFDGRLLYGHAGDTLASALLANGVRLVGRSFKYHRPRGIYSAGPEEPNALVRLGVGAKVLPNTRATMVDLTPGLCAASQNRWPSLRHDALALTDRLSAFLPAGFYYKTFKWPAAWWPFYERLLRNMAGLGTAPSQPDPDHYDWRHAHCDVLVIGAGAAGLAAASAAVQAGARVMLVDERALPGGRLRDAHDLVDGLPGAQWAQQQVDWLVAHGATVLRRATAFGWYDGNLVGVAELCPEDPLAPVRAQRLWHIRARTVVLAAGAIERPLLFAGNDTPGVMLAGAVRTYVNQYGVTPGHRVAVYANNDDAWHTAWDLRAAGVQVAAIIDPRPGGAAQTLQRAVAEAGILYLPGHEVVRTFGRLGLRGLKAAPVSGLGGARDIDCDALAVSGGWTPTVHLYRQAGGRLRFDAQRGASLPDGGLPHAWGAGACAGQAGLSQALDSGFRAGSEAARHAGARKAAGKAPLSVADSGNADAPLWLPRALSEGRRRVAGKVFVDLQADVTVDDVAGAVRENYVSVEHVKRYTALGMGTDQGKTAVATAWLASLRVLPPAAIGNTTYRPPYTPVTLGLLAGRATDHRFAVRRRGPLDDVLTRCGAIAGEANGWRTAVAWPLPGESRDQALAREAAVVHGGSALACWQDMARIYVQGPDAGAFLDRVCTSPCHGLEIGQVLQTLLLRDDGMVLCEALVLRLAQHAFLLCSGSVAPDRLFGHLQFLRQTAWPDWRVRLCSAMDATTLICLWGPGADALRLALSGHDGRVAGVPVVAQAVGGPGLTGLRGWDIVVGSHQAAVLWEQLLVHGRAHGLTCCGSVAIQGRRLACGVPGAAEINGRVTAADLGLAQRIQGSNAHVGAVLSARPGLQSSQRHGLVKIRARVPGQWLRAGALLHGQGGGKLVLGWLTSVTPPLPGVAAMAFAYVRQDVLSAVQAGQASPDWQADSALHGESLAVVLDGGAVWRQDHD